VLRRGNKAQPDHGAAGAENADQLPEVFLSLPSQITLQTQDLELTIAFSAAGAALVLFAAGLSLWRNRLP